MTMTIDEAIAWIHSRLPFGSRPGLERVEALLEKIGHPERQVPTIHIAGTNGKGSTVTYLRCMLEEMGLTVGSFTSPYIESFNERIAINGQPIPEEKLIGLVEKYQPIVKELDQQPSVAGITEFETLTVMALEYFLTEAVDVAIVEVGLGGLLDSTNVVEPLLTGITTIGLDHTAILGETIEEIAQQKAGIIKPGIPVVTGNIPASALEVIEATAKKKQAEHFAYNQAYEVVYLHPDQTWGEVFDFYNAAGKLSGLTTALLGQHQVENAGMAIELCYQYCQINQLPFQKNAVARGLQQAKWPGRMERISQEPLIILDGAHNEHAMSRLVSNLKAEFPDYHLHILFSALNTKDITGMLTDLETLPNSQLYITTFDYPQALNLADFTKWESEQTSIVSMWEVGLGEILEKLDNESLLLVTGSLYFISEVRGLLVEIGGEYEEN